VDDEGELCTEQVANLLLYIAPVWIRIYGVLQEEAAGAQVVKLSALCLIYQKHQRPARSLGCPPLMSE
jgi:hypothetical protein